MSTVTTAPEVRARPTFQQLSHLSADQVGCWAGQLQAASASALTGVGMGAELGSCRVSRLLELRLRNAALLPCQAGSTAAVQLNSPHHPSCPYHIARWRGSGRTTLCSPSHATHWSGRCHSTTFCCAATWRSRLAALMRCAALAAAGLHMRVALSGGGLAMWRAWLSSPGPACQRPHAVAGCCAAFPPSPAPCPAPPRRRRRWTGTPFASRRPHWPSSAHAGPTAASR